MLSLPITCRNLSLPTVYADSTARGESEYPMLPPKRVEQETKMMMAAMMSATMMMGARYTLIVSPC